MVERSESIGRAGPGALAVPAPVAKRSVWARGRRLVTRDPIGTLGAVMVLFVILVAVLANLIAPYDPVAQITKPLQPPNNIFLLGTDEFGRDVLSRIIHGSRVSLYVGVVAVAIALVSGSLLGMIAGFFGGRTDN